MPTRDPADRLAPTSSGVHLLLDLTIAGCTYRIADEYLEVTDEDGSTLAYVEGLDLDYETTAAWFSDSLGEVSFPLSVVLADVDWAELHSLGHDLAAGTASLSRWVEGDTYGQRQLLIEGVVTSPTFGALGEPLSFSLSTLPLNDAGSWPPAAAVITTETWPYAHETALGKMPAWVFGCPGWWDTPDGGRLAGSPAYCVYVDNDLWIVAGHPVKAASVWVRNFGDPSDTWQAATAVPTTDGLGRAVTIVENLGYDLTGGVEIDVWVSWAPLPCGWILTPNGASISDGETFTISDGTTSKVFEFDDGGGGVGGGHVAVVYDSGLSTATQMGQHIIDAINGENWTIRAIRGPNTSQFRVLVINTSPGTAGNVSITDTVASGSFTTYGMVGGCDEDSRGGLAGRSNAIERGGDLLEWWLQRSTLQADYGALAGIRDRLNTYRMSGYLDEPVKPFDWIKAHLLELLPIALIVGPRGLMPILWRYEPQDIDPVYTFDVDELEAERTGAVELGDPGDVYNGFTLQWALQAHNEQHVETTTLDGATTGAANFGGRLSVLRYGARQKALETDLVYDRATAGRVLAWMAYAFGLPAARVTYEVPRQNALHLAVGDIVSVSDDELHFASKLHHVVGVKDTGDGTLELTLRSLEEPSRS